MTHRKVAIITDSTAYLPKALAEQNNIQVVPIYVHWGAQSYRDGVDISSADFFERLKTDKSSTPTTSVPSVGEIRDTYAKAAETAEAVIGLHLSAKLSGTYSAAVQAKDLLADQRITVVDSQATAMALGFMALAAARAAAAGQSAEEVLATIEKMRPNVGLVFTVETLEYLHRGGRIGGAQAFFGGLLDTKPILELRDGRVESVARVRTKKKALEHVLETVATKAQGQTPIRVATIHAAAEQEAAELLEKIKTRLGATEAILAEASPTIATHTGPGTVGLAFCTGI